MPPAHPTRRPRPGPRRPGSARPPAPRSIRSRAERAGAVAAAVAAQSTEPIKAPGFAAYLRRHPKLGPRAAISAIAGGVALFVTATAVTPLAGANVYHPGARLGMDAQAVPIVPPLAIDPSGVAIQRLLTSAPEHAKRQAPVSHGVISALAANGIPQVALNAYRVAAARMANVDPGCGIDWALLAGIGREESDHGQFGGAVLHADGVSTPPIIGPALDGVHWDYIPAPPNGLQLDGDAKYAHALGPMQFIPSTWAIYGTDANGDGKADIFNINDAALSAARYLCAAGGDLRTHAGLVRAVLAYNHSDQYLAQVLALADAYRRGIPVTGIPVGITSGPLPKIHHHGSIPPANPGGPTAGGTSGSSQTPKPSSSASKSGSPSPSPTGTRSSPPGSTPAPTPTRSGSTPAPSPSPSPSSTCNVLDQLLHKCTP